MCTRTVSCRVSPCSRAVLQCQHHSKTFVKMCAGGVRITGDFQHKNKTRRVVEQDVHNDSSDVSCYCYCVYVCVCVCTSVGREKNTHAHEPPFFKQHSLSHTCTKAKHKCFYRNCNKSSDASLKLASDDLEQANYKGCSVKKPIQCPEEDG